ncbi:bifunctional arginine demethylase and lysyl-hydroxylase JMJD6-A [Brachionus plicatilis]|uniref:Bifunctional arginine demethylase and lysyl-hydroxylase JMJD6-A n=1 Tax=Brachionus plicatilis TaxID=10195 RepID=A0A3M7T9K1_BRAPC|nr:bifunctional arginine demethylase and lysyl-hydroxylase JMJD6-A [Brachionus plicatilis]
MKAKIEESVTSRDNIEDVLNQTYKLLQNKQIDKSSIKNSISYKKLQFSISIYEDSNKSLFRKIISFWDIFIYVILITFFIIYLVFFASVYLSSDAKYKSNFSRKIDSFSRWLIAKWLYWNDFTDLTKEECALILPDFTNAITRPFDDCSMCHNLTEIKRIKQISKDEFIAKYAYSGVPVIITDAINEWSGLRTFNFDFFKDLYSNLEQEEYKKRQSKVEIDGENSSVILETFNSIIESDNQRADSKITCQFFPYKTQFQNLMQVFEMEAGNDGKWEKPWYVGWSNCNNFASKVLREHYKRPYFLPDESEMSRIDWIFMGTPGYGANLHIDDVSNPTWQAQISGIKIWTFKPPAECLLKCPSSLTTEVKPGEIIIFDSNRWFHSTFIKGKELSVAICSEYD